MLARQSFSHKKAQKAQIDYGNLFVPFVLFCGRTNKKRSPAGATSLRKYERLSLRGAGVFFGLSEHATAVERIVDDLAHCRSFRINVHSVARFQVSDDALCSNLKSQAVQLRITTRLDVIDSHNPLI